jgi:tetratricopeptide (TPR) repeat protein
VWAVSVALLAILAVRTFFQCGVWQDSITLYTNAVSVNPDGRQITQNLAVAYDMAGRTDLATTVYLRCIDQRPNDPEAYDNLALALPRLEAMGPQWYSKAAQLHEMLAGYDESHDRPADARRQRDDAIRLRHAATP